ncbi:GntR family transcriptional regulator [Brevibacterium sanguinis]|uniref:GntR family transcriptional regulator n=2 Tax=Brevibacterium TaxID=1696 RepID=A0A366IHF6_9MICO|nr:MULTISPECIES: GntR family transcriptional regulator [Brevibacterium]RBP65020.1 GntR family transcriptional regulator [Brevibacterium sanguinis]RBP71283.1 GntR family transcriptional regulator [Brevibacterium celere]
MLTKEAQTTSLAQRAYDTIRHRLIMLDIAPGEAINEAALSAELEVGRTPVREALKHLERDHLVVSYPRRGTFASNVDITDLAAISEMRLVLEPLAARRAAGGLTPELREQFTDTIAAIDSLDPDGDARQLMERDLDVHRLIYSAVDNPHLKETLVRLDDLATRIWCLVLPRIPDVTGHIREHTELLEAVLAGDESRAEQLAAEHVREFETTVRAALG